MDYKESRRQKNFKKFLDNVHKKFGNKFDYSKVNYIDAHTKIIVICPEHGKIYIDPDHHSRSIHGCEECYYDSKKLLFSEFVKRSSIIHNDKYSYNDKYYLSAHEKTTITCPSHGEFTQKPSQHMLGKGCLKCWQEREKYGLKDFIIDATKVHGDKFKYTSSVFIDLHTSISIICPIHGEFYTRPDHHIDSKFGSCRKCSVDDKKLTLAEFVFMSTEIHGNKYLYDNVVYINNWTPVLIKCKKHGDFLQRPADHISKTKKQQGCPKCVESRGENIIRIVLEKYNCSFLYNTSKIGCINPKTNVMLRFDFWLKEYNLCIEFDGICHYEPVNWSGSASKKEIQEKFENYKYRDEVKTKFCIDNGIKLIRIPYWEIKNIEKIITEYLLKHKRITL